MKIKVAFEDRDEVLGALVRALAVQVGGFQMGKGMDKAFLAENGYYEFDFATIAQTGRFQVLIDNYLEPKLRNKLAVKEISN
jgi:hypothetical protein